MREITAPGLAGAGVFGAREICGRRLLGVREYGRKNHSGDQSGMGTV